MYRISSKLVKENWDNVRDLSDSMGVLLSTWNSAFYRARKLNYSQIESAVNRNKRKLNECRIRNIISVSDLDIAEIEPLYNDMLSALEIKKTGIDSENGVRIIKSPVSAAKALHLLCPDFFPLWDRSIANAYGCKWKSTEDSFDSYLRLMIKCEKQVIDLSKEGKTPLVLHDVTILKLIDEYNYVMFTLKGTSAENPIAVYTRKAL